MAGYGWFLRRMADEDVRYAWGYGGRYCMSRRTLV